MPDILSVSGSSSLSGALLSKSMVGGSSILLNGRIVWPPDFVSTGIVVASTGFGISVECRVVACDGEGRSTSVNAREESVGCPTSDWSFVGSFSPTKVAQSAVRSDGAS